ncbi:hypothetical protein [Halocatena marina]|uniref:hypothetical protein n=1 Tax=Halocatena marina TaxID=2934937 RepID=UPI00200EECFE|nr:hypothetical protein [Halocatena marina]
MTDEDRERAEGGEYVETVTPERVLDVLRQQERPFITTTDVAEALGCSTETARVKLGKLDDKNGNGTLRREDIGSRTVVWWLPSENDE